MPDKLKLAIFDRDGVINYDTGHVGVIKDFEFVSEVIPLLKKIQDSHRIVIFTNQAGIAKNMYSLSNFFETTGYMLKKLEEENVDIFHVLWCPHHASGENPVFAIDCECRKPKIGMLNQIKQVGDINLYSSFVVGDKLTDLKAGKNFGIKNLYLVDFSSKHNKINQGTIKSPEALLSQLQSDNLI